MKVQFTINNYTLGAKLKTTPTHKIVEQNRIDKNHTTIIFDEITERELIFIEKVLAKKGIIL